MNLIVGFFAVMLVVLTGCSHKSVTQEMLTPDYLLEKGTKQLTFLGDNSRPRFSPDGLRLIYSSRKRAHHTGAQIYELDLKQNKERRITFSDGDAFDPSYINNFEILYASTTDEIKESPLRNKNFDSDVPPSDLYSSDLFGTLIRRLTQQPGYDGQPVYLDSSKSSPALIFNSRRGELFGIYRLDLKKFQVSLISAQKEKARQEPTLAPDQNQLAWREKDLKSQEESLVLFDLKKKIRRTLAADEGRYGDLSFAPRPPLRLFYSILRKGEKQYQIEVLNLETQCTQVVFKGRDSLQNPTLSDERQERIAFTRSYADKKQIYIATLPEDLGPCLSQPSQDNLKK